VRGQPDWGSFMRIRIPPALLTLGTAALVIAAAYLLLLVPPRLPNVAATGPQAGVADACPPGSRTGRPDLHELQTSDQLTIAVRTPSNYDPTRAYPLLVIFPPAGYNRHGSEIFYGLTPEATRRGFIVAYSDHRSLSPAAVSQQAKVATTVASFFCVNRASITYLGHSDGGSMAEGIPAYIPDTGVAPRTIVASGAGITGEDLAARPCPSVALVMIVHSRNDERFPGFGRGAAAYWGRCAGCTPADFKSLTDGCLDFSGCAKGRRVTYCETSLGHKRWPEMNNAMLDFIQTGEANPP
jgi:polyhydroxybutyrate depolymerase